MENKNFQAPLDPFSEYAFAAENDHYPKTDFTQMQFRGKIDTIALSEAFDQALTKVPMFSSHLQEKRVGWRYQPFWNYDPEVPNKLQVVDCRHLVKHPFEPMEFSTDYYALRTRRRIDLSREFPFNCSLLRVSDDAWIFSILYHHCAMDPNKAYSLLTEMLAAYHEKVKGKPPEWAGSLGMAALKRGGALVKPIPMLNFAKEQLADVWIRNRAGLVSNIASEQIRDYKITKGRHSFRTFIDDPKLIKALFNRVKRNDATFNDLAFAVARKAITKWNEERGVGAERFRFLLITSLKGRMELPKDAGAGLAGLNFVNIGQGHADLDTLIRFYRDTRSDQLRRGIDIQFYNTTCSIIRTLRLFPMSYRFALAGAIGQSIPCTFYISNLGVVWPKFVDGKPTMDSAVLGAGDFIIDDIHSSASLGRTVGMGLTMRTHNRRLYLNFVADRFRFKYDEAKELSNRMINDLISAG